MSGYVVMKLQASVSMSMTYIATKDHEDVPSLGSHLWSQRYTGAVQNWPYHLTGYGTLESWPHISPVAELGRDGDP